MSTRITFFERIVKCFLSLHKPVLASRPIDVLRSGPYLDENHLRLRRDLATPFVNRKVDMAHHTTQPRGRFLSECSLRGQA